MGELSAAAVVVPTIGRDSLQALLESLSRSPGERLGELVVVDDRPQSDGPLCVAGAETVARNVRVVASHGRGPAAARNAGWRATSQPYVCFLDDDVEVGSGWRAALARDLDELAGETGAVCATIDVPLPADRRPTDWERNVAGLSRARWITADMAFRRDALERIGGFDERFRRAYREDSDAALRLIAAGYAVANGSRATRHPVRPSDAWISVRLQRGNGDDVLMRALHGPDWRERAGAPPGRFVAHAAIVAAAAASASAFALGAPRTGIAFAGTWLALTANFAAARILPGPRDAREIRAMLLTSAVIPFAAVYHACAAALTLRRRLRTAQ